jgi:N-acetylmuramoyl-L-alanine amidase
MRHHRARPLHVLVLAPVAAMLAGVLGPAPHAFAAAPTPPRPIVIAVDPGFGGRPTAAHPDVPFDPGATGTNGILEKDVDLDVGLRLAALLRADLVDVVMTRSSDVYVSDARRLQLSTSHHASLVVGVRAGSSADQMAGGSSVLYSASTSRAFAQILSDALGAQLASDGVRDRGAAFGSTAWARSPVPAAIVSMAYLSNPAEAELMATSVFRQDVATALRNGVEAYMPGIIARRDAIRAWRAAHHETGAPDGLSPASARIPEGTGFQFGPLIVWLVAVAAVGLVLLFRDAVARILVVIIAVVVRLFGGVLWLQRAAIRRRRRRRRVRTGLRADQPAPRSASVYDDIPL